MTTLMVHTTLLTQRSITAMLRQPAYVVVT